MTKPHPNYDQYVDEYSKDPIDVAYREALLEKYRVESKQSAKDDTENAYYNDFRKSIQKDDLDVDELDDPSDLDYSNDMDYTNRADQSFYVTDSDSPDELDEEYLEDDSENDAKENLIDDVLDTTTGHNDPDQNENSRSSSYSNTSSNDSNDYITRNIQSSRPRFQWFRLFVVLLVLTMLVPILPVTFRLFSSAVPTIVPHSGQSSTSYIDKSSSFATLQKQINHIYNELGVRDEKQKREFDEKVKIIISQFEKNIKKLLPKKLMNFEGDVSDLKKKLDDLASKYDTLKEQLVTHRSNEELYKNALLAIRNAEQLLPESLPVVLDNSTNSLELTEIREHISTFIIKSVENLLKSDILPPDDNSYIQEQIESYVNTVIDDKMSMFNYGDFVNEVKRDIEENKVELWNDIKEYMERWRDMNLATHVSSESNENISASVLRKIILQVYNSNRYQWENDLDFATTVQGSSIISSLTSRTYPRGNNLDPKVLLLDSVFGSPSAYWQGQMGHNEKCNVAIKFNRPLHLTRLFYLHGRLINNLHVMNSAPQNISIFVRLHMDRDLESFIIEARRNGQGVQHTKDGHFVKIGTFKYDLESMKIRQQFYLPTWYINLKPLVNAVIFQVENTYGNEQITSLRKFIINGVVESDLEIIKAGTFPLRFRHESYIPEYNSEVALDATKPQRRLPDVLESTITRPTNVPAFGDDEKVK